MLLAVLLFLTGAPALGAWTPVPDGPAVAAPQTHDVVSGRQATPRTPAATPLPWAVTPASPGAPPASSRSRVERTAEAPPAIAPPTSRHTRAPPSFAS
ncbi:hypothetical protein M8542_40375 [Amycolatopsis sp. OK19-0408]|uniref:Uncharacterized protein n=1 Tax=Amycolatopsis iheyensis TaxID=2945988 RepID=A0A9X2SQV1_9PSEU|nr:hypothetical protein [Amycolatopsis iheyensis]MCR6489100.1 hypothetical protein [Amycolatopsis iheyensis]